jgi:16S rRNA G966 N2-methylase RsmD
VDSSRVAAGIVRDNLRLTGLEAQATVHQRDFSAFLNSVRGNKYGLVFLDPPYAQTLLEDALKTIVEIDIVSGNGIIICESALDKQLPDLPDPYEKGKEYRYGKIKVTIYRRRV